jgi:hypothetical protein
MDIQAGFRSFDIELSDGSSIEVEFYFKLSTGDENSIANEQMEKTTLATVADPMQMLLVQLLYEPEQTDDEQTDDDEEELELEEDDERE